jgi:hypothetical protein
MKIREIIRIVISLALLAVIIVYMISNGSFSVLEGCSLSDLAILLLLTFSGYIVAGWQMNYLLRVQNGIRLSTADMLLLPFSMSLFAYIIPTNGGLLYSVFFLKKKYKLESSKGFSIGIFSIYTSFILTGIIGCVTAVVLKQIISILMIVSMILIISPFLIKIINDILLKLGLREGSLMQRAQAYVNDVIVSSNDLVINKKAFFVTTMFNVLLIILLFLTYLWLAEMFKLVIAPVSLLFIILALRISSLLRVLPGNLGIEELMTGGIFGLIGLDPGTGLLFALAIRVSAIVLFTPLGIFHTVFNTNYFILPDLRRFVKQVKSDTED